MLLRLMHHVIFIYPCPCLYGLGTSKLVPSFPVWYSVWSGNEAISHVEYNNTF